MRTKMGVLALASVAMLAASTAGAQTYRVWPDLSGGACSASLQACIDAAAPGDSAVVGNLPGAADTYHDHRAGLEYTGGHRQICNEDRSRGQRVRGERGVQRGNPRVMGALIPHEHVFDM